MRSTICINLQEKKKNYDISSDSFLNRCSSQFKRGLLIFAAQNSQMSPYNLFLKKGASMRRCIESQQAGPDQLAARVRRVHDRTSLWETPQPFKGGTKTVAVERELCIIVIPDKAKLLHSLKYPKYGVLFS